MNVTRRFFLQAGLAAGACAIAHGQTEGARTSPPYILLKVDDLRSQNGGVNPRWNRLVDFLKERKVKAGIGIICDSLENAPPGYIQWIKTQRDTGLFEFWNHGYDHKNGHETEREKDEFSGSSLAYQKEHLAHANRLAKEKLGFPLPAFGAPSNAIDETTVQALAEDPDTKIWLYGNAKKPAGKLVLERVGAVNIENPIFTPSVEKLVAGYRRYPRREYFLIQGHPATWDEARFEQFIGIIDFLTKEGAIFTTPSEYAALRAAAPAPERTP